MSATLLLVIPENRTDLTDLRRCLDLKFVVSGDMKSLTVEQRGVREKVFGVQVTDFVSEGVFEDWPDERIPRGPVSVFSFDYVSSNLMLGVVRALAECFDAIVDTNYGAVIPSRDLTSEHLPQGLA
jgi:hypothetical protein